MSVESDDPQAYIEAMRMYFNQNGDMYAQIMDHLNRKNQEMQRLSKFEKNVLSGKNKDAAINDFKNTSSKLEDLKIKLAQVEDLIDHKDENYKKRDMPQTAEGILSTIDEDFITSNKKA